MQHLDEGTIHAWLDGALRPEEAAQADTHVKDCPQCQAAVAEARGFIAASSRILTALDDAPSGVIPMAAPKRRVQPWIWRVAATVLLVATGTLLLVKQRGGERTIDSRVESTAPAAATANSALAVAADSVAAGTAAASPLASVPPTNRAAAAAGTTGLSVKSAPIRAASKRAVVLDNAGSPRSTVERRSDADLRAAASAPATTPPAIAGRAFSAIPGALSTESTPREVGTTRSVGRTRTFYEIAPGDTVVLEEQSSVALQNVVVTGAAAARQVQPQAQRTNKSAAAAAAVESEQKAEAAAAPAPAPAVPPLQDAPTAEHHSISWLDPSTRRVVILSGRHSQEELQKIREQIQRLRDTAQAKRNPD